MIPWKLFLINLLTITFQRPIVAFSIENRLVLQARQRRTDKSKICNPLFNKQQPTPDSKNKKFNNEKNKNNNRTALSKKKTADLPEYTGITAKEVIQYKAFMIFSLEK